MGKAEGMDVVGEAEDMGKVVVVAVVMGPGIGFFILIFNFFI